MSPAAQKTWIEILFQVAPVPFKTADYKVPSAMAGALNTISSGQEMGYNVSVVVPAKFVDVYWDGLIDVVNGTRDADEVFYLRPVGTYRDRQGKSYEYTEDHRMIDRIICIDSAGRFKLALDRGMSEEHARDLIPYAIRQHFVVSFNLRSAFHYMDLRSKRDAQLEIQQMCDLIWPHIEAWAPDIAAWYAASRLHKARLAP